MKNNLFICLFLIFSIISLFSCKKSINYQKEVQGVMQADIDFSNYSLEHGFPKAFLEFCDDNAVALHEGEYPTIGRKELEKYYLSKHAENIKLSWKPLNGTVSENADMGFTYGVWQAELFAGTDSASISKGTYVTGWKKDKNGKWKWIMDAGNDGLPE